MLVAASCLSILFLFLSVILVFRLARLTPTRLPWILLALAILLTLVCRSFALHRHIVSSPSGSLLLPELVGLGASTVLLAALLMLFSSLRSAALSQERARLAERQLRVIADSLPVCVSYVDASQRYRFANKTYALWFGGNADDFVGKAVVEVVGPAAYEVARPNILAALSGKTVSFEGFLPPTVPSSRYVSGTLIPDADGARNVRGYVCLLADLSDRRRAEEALAESERRLSTLLTNLPGMAYRCRNDRDWTMEFVSDGALELTGYPPSGLVANRVTSYGRLIHPDDAEDVWSQVQRALRSHRPFRLIYRILPRDGSVKWVWEQGRGVFSPDRDLLALEGFITDVTERKLLEHDLLDARLDLERKVEDRTADLAAANDLLRIEIAERRRADEARDASQALYRLLAENVSDVIWTTDLDLRLTYASPSVALQRGFTPEETVGRRIDEVLTPASAALAYQAFTKNLALERSEGPDPLRSETVEVEIVRKDGSTVWAEVHISFLRDPQGRPTGLLGVSRDVTARRRAQQALRRYADRLEARHEIDEGILAGKPIEAIARDALRRIRPFLPSPRAVVLLFDEEARKASVLALDTSLPTSFGVGFVYPIDTFQNLDSMRAAEVRFVPDIGDLPDSSGHLARLRAEGLSSYIVAPLVAQGHLIGAINLAVESPSSLTDETREVLSEIPRTLAVAIRHARLDEQVRGHARELETRVRERTADLEAFSYSVSHDLRAPVRSIDGFAQLLLRDHADALDEPARGHLDAIRRSARWMTRLIDDLLRFSRAGRVDLRLSSVDMDSLAKAALSELAALEPARRVEVSLSSLPPAVADPSLVGQVLANLLSNAFKFTRARPSARIEVGAQVPQAPDDEVVYYVSDNGIGFDMQYKDKLFSVFSRLHSDAEFEGTGVGLAIVERIIRRHGGRVWADSRPGEGATFFFTLPAPRTQPPADSP
ncbi:MAG: PAS domain S-box protein [Planctomycetota bacterium]